jgi:hypothetical protein
MTQQIAFAVAATKDDDEASVNNILGILNLLIPIYPTEEDIISDLRDTSKVADRTFVKITVEVVDDLDPTGEKLAAILATRDKAVKDDNLTVGGDDAFGAALGDFLDGDDDNEGTTADEADRSDDGDDVLR